MKSDKLKKCVERGKIKKFSKGIKLAGKELDLAGEDLKSKTVIGFAK